MGKAKNYALNHSRTLHVFANEVGQSIVNYESSRATVKQKRFYYRLTKICEENGIEAEPVILICMNERWAYSNAIDATLEKLEYAGVNIEYGDKREHKKFVPEHKLPWIDPAKEMPEEEPANEALKKALKTEYKIKNVKTCSHVVKARMKTNCGEYYSLARVINGTFAFNELRDKNNILTGWLPLDYERRNNIVIV